MLRHSEAGAEFGRLRGGATSTLHDAALQKPGCAERPEKDQAFNRAGMFVFKSQSPTAVRVRTGTP